jgi:hypothetical protein
MSKSKPRRRPHASTPQVITAQKWFEPAEAAAYIGMSVDYLAMGRRTGDIGNRTPTPPHHKMGRNLVKYSKADLDAWLAERRVVRPTRPKKSNTSEPAAAP